MFNSLATNTLTLLSNVCGGKIEKEEPKEAKLTILISLHQLRLNNTLHYKQSALLFNIPSASLQRL